MNKSKPTELKRISRKISKVFNKIEIKVCTMCGEFIPGDIAKQFEGVCKKHWDY